MGPGPDKVVESLLLAQVAALQTNDALFDGYLHGYPDAAIASCRTQFRRNRPTPKLGFGRTGDQWPVWAILLMGEQPSQEFIGRSGGVQAVGDPPVQHQQYVTVTDPTIAIWVYTENADLTRWHSDLVKAIMLAATKALVAEFTAVAFSGAMDLSPEQAMAPENLWVRSQTWEFTTAQSVLVPVESLITTLAPPVYAGVVGEDLGDGVSGGTEPY